MLYELITRELPYLRRYARAMTGDQATGDRYVEAMLQEYVLTPRSIDTPLPSDRIALFALLDSVVANPGSLQRAGTDLPVFPALSSLPRRALFLSAVEQLDPAAVSEILGIPVAQLDHALADAEQEMAAALATDVLIIEDEPVIAFQLKEIVESLGHRMAARATMCDEAVHMARSHVPGLILVDIHLADGSSGLEAMTRIREFTPAPAVFITAYPERMLAGRFDEPAFLIPKPFLPAHVRVVISQALLTRRRD